MGNGRNRHAGLQGLLDQPDLRVGRVAAATVDTGDDVNALEVLQYRCLTCLSKTKQCRSESNLHLDCKAPASAAQRLLDGPCCDLHPETIAELL
ncbi:MAG: hypothetical protein JWO26_1973 [Rhodospirillales bacterium]|nr:hypothetical protein [Rhodospirillales bacterium]